MAYIPQNLNMFTAAFAGALAGMGASDRVPTDAIPGDYTGLANVAGAFAKSFDTAWGATPENQLDIECAEELCESAWQNRAPQAITPFLTQSTYNGLAAALVAMIKAGDSYFAGQGITPPPTPGASGGGRIGVLIVNLPPDNPGQVIITPAMLNNPGHPGSTYRAIRFTGGLAEAICSVVLPKPATENDSNWIIFENKSNSLVTATVNANLSGDTFELQVFFGTEASLEAEIQAGAEGYATYRTEVLYTPNGAYRTPGFSTT